MKFNKITLLKIALAILGFFYIINQARTLGDFTIYLGAADLLAHGKTCYNVWIETKPGFACGYSYSPFFATILIPFTLLPEPIPQVLWLMLNVFFLYRIWQIIMYYTQDFILASKQMYLWYFLTLLLSIRFILHNFEMVQMTIFLVFVSLEAVRLSEKNKNLKSGVLLALGIVIKILPLVILPYFIYKKRFKAFLFSIIFFALFLIIPSIFFGWDFNLQLLQDWFTTLNPSNTEFITEQNANGEGIHSLSGLIAGYFTANDNTVQAPFSRVIMSLKAENISLMLNISRLVLVSFTLYFLGFLRKDVLKNKIQTLWELSYIFAIVPLIFPHQQKYAFFYMLPATAYVIYFLIKIHIQNYNNFSKNKFYFVTFLMSLFFVLSTLTTDGLIGNFYNEISEYYKTITFGDFLLLIALFLAKPKFLNNNSK